MYMWMFSCMICACVHVHGGDADNCNGDHGISKSWLAMCNYQLQLLPCGRSSNEDVIAPLVVPFIVMIATTRIPALATTNADFILAAAAVTASGPSGCSHTDPVSEIESLIASPASSFLPESCTSGNGPAEARDFLQCELGWLNPRQADFVV